MEVSSEEAKAFDAPSAEESLSDEIIEMYVTVKSPSFEEGNRWRLGTGSETITAKLADDRFFAAVDAGEEAFRSGDMLKCRMRVVQTRDSKGLHLSREIIEVLEHIPREVQISFDDAVEDQDPE